MTPFFFMRINISFKLYQKVNFIIMENLKIVLFSSLILVLTFQNVFSQGTELKREQLQGFTNAYGTLFTKEATTTIGSPYLSNDFLNGRIMLNKRSQSEIAPLRYNMEINQLEFLRDEEIFVVDSKNIHGFKLINEQKNVVFRNGFKSNAKSINSNTLLRVVYDGKTKLVVHYKAKLIRDVATYGSATKENRYTVSKTYYLALKNKKLREINSFEKDLFKILKDHQRELEQYAQKNSLEFDKEKELIDFLKYYDEISS